MRTSILRSHTQVLMMLRTLTILVLGMGVMEAKAATAPNRTDMSPLDFTNHVRQLAKKVPQGFSVTVEPPFVVIGDISTWELKRFSTQTVKWAVDRLKKDYFTRDPEQIIDVWLFKDEQSYEKNVRAVFKEAPISPFGYYSPKHQALIMNIGTGGGTLVHEIVHPFVRANFPNCPAWFNEGLGSLYEQCGDKDGHIYGYTNWRLAGLQKAIQQKTTMPFPKLLAMDDVSFYEDRGPHYAQARYLCYYLQERGLLVRFYKEFVANAKDDPTGVNTLKKVLVTQDLQRFQQTWETFVMKLKFP